MLKSWLDWVSERRKVIFIGGIVVLLTSAAFWPTFKASYFPHDDESHFLMNELIDGNIRTVDRLFFTANSANRTFIPLTMMSFFYEQAWFGPNPLVSHFINFLLHLGVVWLAYLFGRQLKLGAAAAVFATTLFAIHPLHVESVAWITERKDLLYSFFYLASLIFYIRYQDSGKGTFYVFAILSAGLSVLAKPMALSLPIVLFLIDYFRQRRVTWASLWEKVPFFLAVEPVALVTFIQNSSPATVNWQHAPLLWLWCAFFYIQKFFLPVGLAVLYYAPMPISLFHFPYALAVFGSFAVTAVIVRLRHQKWLVFAFWFYVLSTFFLWRFSVGNDWNVVADRFMYLPSLGLCFYLGWLAEKSGFLCSRGLKGILSVVVVVILLFLTFQRSAQWRNCYTIWDANIKVFPSSSEALNERGKCLLADDLFGPCRVDVNSSILRKTGATEQEFYAVFNESASRKLDYARRMLALKDFKNVIRLNPRLADGYGYLGSVYISLGQFEKALPYLTKAIPLNPGSYDYYFNRALAYDLLGNTEKAISDYSEAIRYGGGQISKAYLNLAKLLLRLNRSNESLRIILDGVAVAPNNYELYELAFVIALERGDGDMLSTLSRGLVKLFPDNPRARAARAIYMSATRNCIDAAHEASLAIKLGYPQGDMRKDLLNGCQLAP